jgi:hypothetical protein
MKARRLMGTLLALVPVTGNVFAQGPSHFSCSFGRSVQIDASGVHEGPKWSSKGFTLRDGLIVLDSGGLKLKLTTSIDKFGTVILRGSNPTEGYQFSLEDGKFIYVLLMLPNARSWTVTGTCAKDV